MNQATKITVAAGVALSLGLAAAAVSAHGSGTGWGGGHMGGFGAGPGMGSGPGYSMGYGMGPGSVTGGRGMGYGMGPQAGFDAGAGGVEENLATLRAELGITAGQEPAWEEFAASEKRRHENRQAWLDSARQAPGAGTPRQRSEQRTDLMRQRQEEMQASTGALRNLYATLTPEQRAIADRHFGAFRPGYGPAGR